MISLRESLVALPHGMHGLIADRRRHRHASAAAGPLNSWRSRCSGADPRSQQLMSSCSSCPRRVVERLLVPYLGPVSGCRRVRGRDLPSLAITLFFVSREGLLMVILAGALAVALSAGREAAGRASSAAILALCRWRRRRASR